MSSKMDIQLKEQVMVNYLVRLLPTSKDGMSLIHIGLRFG